MWKFIEFEISVNFPWFIHDRLERVSILGRLIAIIEDKLCGIFSNFFGNIFQKPNEKALSTFRIKQELHKDFFREHPRL